MNIIDYIAIVFAITAFVFVAIIIGIVIVDHRKSKTIQRLHDYQIKHGNDTLP